MYVLIIIFSLILIFGVFRLIKFMFTKWQFLKNNKDQIIVYTSWVILWLWVLNSWFYDIYLYTLQYGKHSSMGLIAVAMFIVFQVPLVAIVYLIVMLAVAKMLKRQLTSHIVVGFLAFIFSVALPDCVTGFAQTVALRECMPKWVVSFFNTSYNIFFLVYIIGFLIYGIVMRNIHIREKQLHDKQ